MATKFQVKLLRVLQERESERVGDSKTRKADIRIVTATNRDQIEISDKMFCLKMHNNNY